MVFNRMVGFDENIGLKKMILARLYGGDNTRRISQADDAEKLFS
jgi:hypothetical protein